jgi:hypothetical protein
MSITRTGAPRARTTLLRELATQAASHPRIEAAVLGAIRAELPGVIEGLLRDAYGGDTVRIYVPRGASREDKVARDQRIRALSAAPSSLSPHAIAAREGISVRRVQQILLQPAAKD